MLTAAAVIPASILLCLSIYNQYQSDERDAAVSAHNLAQLTADNVQTFLTDSQQVLLAIARRLKAVGDAVWFKQVYAARKFTVGPPYLGPVTRRTVSVLSQPLFDDTGNMTGSIQMPIDLAKFRVIPGAESCRNRQSSRSSIPPGCWSRAPATANTWSAKTAATSRSSSCCFGKKGTGVSTTSEGVERVFGFVAIPGTEWFAVAVIATDAVCRRPNSYRLPRTPG